MKSIICLLVAIAVAGPAFADDANTNPCKAPISPTAQSSELVIKLFNKRLTAYKKCIDTFVEERRAVVKESTDPAKAKEAYDAAEAAQKEFNALIEEVNAKSAPPPEEK